ncbi:GNAT family N-acetyltransferase [Lichenifustis flavocetrariae]|uniref:GNAT family N-acetyltransferase n=1 Tax=Lichenifustis flavocetrariae TaxID=2949735 RepID=A0AA42CL71_9HYPH|nr:GNAT family N-acetyltransferase [Lichenifustis flavocetrariae]MCW6511298.1 GNAT family N-acetyltransferase [Lichenifustis flavocetrariae]
MPRYGSARGPDADRRRNCLNYRKPIGSLANTVSHLIAVHPDRQGQGRGTALLRHVERVLAARGQRVLLVETSALPAFERTRAFYRQSGYGEEARIRDFYQAGEDKIVFRKALRRDAT